MFEVLYTSRAIESLTPNQIDIKKIYQDKKENKENNEYILIDDNKNKITKLNLLYIIYTYQILYIYV